MTPNVIVTDSAARRIGEILRQELAGTMLLLAQALLKAQNLLG